MGGGDGSMPVNLGATLRWVAGDESLLRELVAIFLEDAPKHLRDLRVALDRRDIREVERIAHGLKGVVANFGAEPARSAAADLEELARTRRLPEAEPLIVRLDVEVNRIVVFFSDPDWRARIGG